MNVQIPYRLFGSWVGRSNWLQLPTAIVYYHPAVYAPIKPVTRIETWLTPSGEFVTLEVNEKNVITSLSK